MYITKFRALVLGVWFTASLLVFVYAVGWRLEARDLQQQVRTLGQKLLYAQIECKKILSP